MIKKFKNEKKNLFFIIGIFIGFFAYLPIIYAIESILILKVGCLRVGFTADCDINVL